MTTIRVPVAEGEKAAAVLLTGGIPSWGTNRIIGVDFMMNDPEQAILVVDQHSKHYTL